MRRENYRRQMLSRKKAAGFGEHLEVAIGKAVFNKQRLVDFFDSLDDVENMGMDEIEEKAQLHGIEKGRYEILLSIYVTAGYPAEDDWKREVMSHARPIAISTSVKPRRRIQLWNRDRKKDESGKDYVPCAYCGCHLNENGFTIDHIKPLSRDGTWDMDNLAVSCPPCNQKKGNHE